MSTSRRRRISSGDGSSAGVPFPHEEHRQVGGRVDARQARQGHTAAGQQARDDEGLHSVLEPLELSRDVAGAAVQSDADFQFIRGGTDGGGAVEGGSDEVDDADTARPLERLLTTGGIADDDEGMVVLAIGRIEISHDAGNPLFGASPEQLRHLVAQLRRRERLLEISVNAGLHGDDEVFSPCL